MESTMTRTNRAGTSGHNDRSPVSVRCALRVLAALVLTWAPVRSRAEGPEFTAKPVPFHGGPYPGGAVAADHAEASRVGTAILARGGNAVDAAVATALAQGIVRPDSAGLGGGGFLVIHRAATGETLALDVRETAPAHARPDMFTREGVRSGASVHGGLAVAVPSLIFGLEQAWKRFGRLRWKDLFPGARALARETVVTAAFHRTMVESVEVLRSDPSLARVFLRPDGSVPAVGEGLAQTSMMRALDALAVDGAEALRSGWIARDLERAVRVRGGILTRADLAAYRPVWRRPVTGRFRGFDVLSMPPPSSGGVCVIQSLQVLEALGDWPARDGVTRAHWLAQAMMHVFADRARSMGDPDFVDVPVGHLVSPARARDLAGRIRSGPEPIEDYGWPALADDHGTTHVSILDREGNAVAMTMSINTSFGAGFLAAGSGIVLNNHMDDFAARPGEPNAFGLIQGESNAVAPGKRPLSSMSPTILLGGGRVALVAGASGGPRIITGTLELILDVMARGLTLSEALTEPRIHHQWKPDVLRVEMGMPPARIEALRGKGYRVSLERFTNAVQAVRRTGRGIMAASDPRKGGAPAGH